MLLVQLRYDYTQLKITLRQAKIVLRLNTIMWQVQAKLNYINTLILNRRERHMLYFGTIF